MKTLTLVRHAKSSWKLNLPDHLRPLKMRGLTDANNVSNHLKTTNFCPDLLWSSNAVRAQSTAEIFIKTLNIPSEICHFNHELYDFSGEYLTFHIKNCPDEINSLMVFGHNDAITNFVNAFGSERIENVPTCGLVTIIFNCDSWQEITSGDTSRIIFPKDLRQ
ncbi:histidine phosphatase family protein [Bizionia sp. M204]|uniref:SixA phosphatase family protein n=1 Tax=unclassified Bizionia TaxID=2626393 RepID=UPI00207028E2|nr:histidine phosphatase family protein [Bizionia sp. M204]UPS90847.1 histidine phosphatase family protein [Bizionia sp. M204]